MNHSIYSADRATHLKIVVVALLTATILTSLTLSLHAVSQPASGEVRTVLKAGKPIVVSSTVALVR